MAWDVVAYLPSASVLRERAPRPALTATPRAQVKDKRGAKLVEKFPQYNGIVVAEFGRTIMDSG